MKSLVFALLLAAPRAFAQTGAPVVNDIAAQAGASGVTISWTTDQPSDTQVEYGLTPAYGNSTPLAPAPVLLHSAALPSLMPNAVYHYRVKSKNASGALGASTDYTFTAPAAGSPAPPPQNAAASDGPPAPQPAGTPGGADGPPAVPAPAAAPAETSPPSVLVMTPAAGAVVSSTVSVSVNASDNVGVASVQLLLDGGALGAPMTYAPFTFRWDTAATADGAHTLAAVALDASGNSATSTVVPLTVDNSAPQLSGVSAAAAGPGTAVVRWKTSERAEERVEYGTTTAYGLTKTASGSPLVEHGAGLTGLAPSTEYHFRVISRDPAGNQAVSGDMVFTTSGLTERSASAANTTAASSDAAALAPQKMLSPARADGINDAAAFGPEAREVSIFDVRGRRVFHAVSAGPSAPIVWDCRDGSGRVLESGVYLATVVKRDGGRINQSFSIAK